MVWELLAIWSIVLAIIVWFVRDERRERLKRLDRQARHYATAARWQHTAPVLHPVVASRRSTRGSTGR